MNGLIEKQWLNFLKKQKLNVKYLFRELPTRRKQKMDVKLTYFKKNGKFYSTGGYDTDESHMEDIYYEVIRKIIKGRLPGLSIGSNDFIVLVDVPEHKDNVLKLLNLDESENGIRVSGNASGNFVSGNGNIIG